MDWKGTIEALEVSDVPPEKLKLCFEAPKEEKGRAARIARIQRAKTEIKKAG